MEMKYLIDTNIFLEIMLLQDKAQKCKDILFKYQGDIALSDFLRNPMQSGHRFR